MAELVSPYDRELGGSRSVLMLLTIFLQAVSLLLFKDISLFLSKGSFAIRKGTIVCKHCGLLWSLSPFLYIL